MLSFRMYVFIGIVELDYYCFHVSNAMILCIIWSRHYYILEFLRVVHFHILVLPLLKDIFF